jgi:hypothetical protein
MSRDWVDDVARMHDKFEVCPAVARLSHADLRKFLEFRINFLQEELDELKNTFIPEDAVDALIDLCVVAIGTLDIFAVDSHAAWDRVLEANMSKVAGVNPSRPNPLGLPDLLKPKNWVPPSHEGNVGMFRKIIK